MNIHFVLGLLGGALQVLAIVPYVRSMLRGKTRPSVVSYSLWLILYCISLSAQLSAGASWSLILLIALIFNALLVLTLCLFGYGYKKFRMTDLVCLVGALVALGIWYVTHSPLTAILCTFAADLFAEISTINKVRIEPASENALSWFMLTGASVLSIASSTIWNVPNLIFPIFYACCGLIIGGLACRNSVSRSLD